jgi:hypothetical protein
MELNIGIIVSIGIALILKQEQLHLVLLEKPLLKNGEAMRTSSKSLMKMLQITLVQVGLG